MRVLVSTTAGSGHFGPLVPFAHACAASGHEVAVAAPASFAEQVAAAGLEHRPFADVPADVMGAVFGRLPSLPTGEADKVVVSEVFGRLDAQAALPGLVATIDEWRPDLVLREPCEFGSVAAAHAAGVPLATVAIGVSDFSDLIMPLVEAPLAELDGQAGLPEGTSLARIHTTPTLTCVPPSLDDPGTSGGEDSTHRFRADPPPGSSGGLPEPWGDPAHPLVYVSFGSVAAGVGDYGRLYAAVLEVFAATPMRLLLTTGMGIDPAELAPVPDNARVERWWPQADVMPHAAAMVGHGGFGTTMAAVAAGVPQAVLPLFSFDQKVNAQRVAAVGAGLHVQGGLSGVAELPAAVDRLLTEPSFRDATERIAAEIQTLPPTDEAVPLLERIASS